MEWLRAEAPRFANKYHDIESNVLEAVLEALFYSLDKLRKDKKYPALTALQTQIMHLLDDGKMEWFELENSKDITALQDLPSQVYIDVLESILKATTYNRDRANADIPGLPRHKAVTVTASLFLHLVGVDRQKFSQGQLVLHLPESLTQQQQHQSKFFLVKLLYELVIICFYLSSDVTARRWTMWLAQVINANCIYNVNLDQQLNNIMIYYIQQFPGQTIHPIEIDLPLIDPGSQYKYQGMNPSIVSCEKGYLINIRAVNYEQKNAVWFKSRAKDDKIRTKNYLVGLSSEYQKIWQVEVVDRSNLPRYDTGIFGLEDCRIFWLNGPQGDPHQAQLDNTDSTNSIIKYGIDFSQLAVSCTTADSRLPFNPQISVGRHGADLCDGKIAIEELIALTKEGTGYRCEKNWLPFIENGKARFIYGYNPLELIDVPVVDQWRNQLGVKNLRLKVQSQCQTKFKKDLPIKLHDYRGSCSPIVCKIANQKVYLVCVHGVIMTNIRYYHSRFLVFNLVWDLLSYTSPFCFKNSGIEYCAGMCLTEDQENIICTYGVEDRQAYFSVIPLKALESQLIYPEEVLM